MRYAMTLSIFFITASTVSLAAEPDTLPGTKPLTTEGDIAAQMVAGVDKFLLRKIDESAAQRDARWADDDDFGNVAGRKKAYLAEKRERLREILGVRDERVPFDAPSVDRTTSQSGLVAVGKNYKVYQVRWPTIGEMWAEGLLLVPNDNTAYTCDIIAIPDADETPEQVLGLVGDFAEDRQFVRGLPKFGCTVLVPTLLSRQYKARNGRAKMTGREFIYRSAFELGRHPITYEIQQVLAGVDWLTKRRGEDDAKIGVVGQGEGGLIAFYSAAVDSRIDAVGSAGYFGRKENVWKQPLDRNLFGILHEFGDAEVARITSSHDFHHQAFPKVDLPSEGGAPGKLEEDDFRVAWGEFDRKEEKVSAPVSGSWSAHNDNWSGLVTPRLIGHDKFMAQRDKKSEAPKAVRLPDAAARQQRILRTMDRYNQALLAESPYVRKERFWNKLDYSSVEAFEKSVAPFREEFKHDVIGHFDDQPLPFNPRTRKAYDEEKWVGYEVMLDLWPDVFCYGILCLPKDMKTDGSEKRPVVVCQHGLEGRPQDIVAGDHRAYHDFASKLCERGFITFSPQNLYIGKDKFRTLQRKANPLGKTLFSIITPQHQQILDWLRAQPYVDGERIGFYGLSYGGKTAMRVPPLVDDYKCVICSADFNDWVWKNASTRSPYSYVWTGEYEIFEWNLAHTFNYAEMAALIAPRPFMVERGHFDGVAPDERVAYEFAKVRHLYNARLKLPANHCQIEWFDGPHTINGKGTFAFLHEHLDWPAPGERGED